MPKQNCTISLETEIADFLRDLGRNNRSGGIELAAEMLMDLTETRSGLQAREKLDQEIREARRSLNQRKTEARQAEVRRNIRSHVLSKPRGEAALRERVSNPDDPLYDPADTHYHAELDRSSEHHNPLFDGETVMPEEK